MSQIQDLSLRFALKSHPGKVRPLNEDAVGADPNIGLFVLADGLGGYNAGEVASTMAVSSLLSCLGAELAQAHRSEDGNFDPARALREALIARNEEIFHAALHSSMYEGMATTAVVAWFLGGRLWVAHAGDSRLYRFRGGALEQVTRDHSFSQELLDAGMISEDEARALPAKNLVTRAVGASPSLEPEVHEYELQAGDIILLCSDGLTEMVSNEDISAMMGADEHNIAQAARRLVENANEAGGRDNCSVILVRVDGVPMQAAAPVEGGEVRPADAKNEAGRRSNGADVDPDGVPEGEAAERPGETAQAT
jgi:PPM family protein phosphatase